MQYCCKKEKNESSASNADETFEQRGRRISTAWKAMPGNHPTRAKYIKLAKEDALRYKEEMIKYRKCSDVQLVLSQQQQQHGKHRKVVHVPKSRPISGYNIFVREAHARSKRTQVKTSTADIARKWSALSPSEKLKWTSKAQVHVATGPENFRRAHTPPAPVTALFNYNAAFVGGLEFAGGKYPEQRHLEPSSPAASLLSRCNTDNKTVDAAETSLGPLLAFDFKMFSWDNALVLDNENQITETMEGETSLVIDGFRLGHGDDDGLDGRDRGASNNTDPGFECDFSLCEEL